MKKFFKIIGIAFGVFIVLLLSGLGYIVLALPGVGEPEVVTIEPTPQRIERGRYLANHVAVCMDCHSTRQWHLYAGPMAVEGIGAGGEVFSQDMGFPGKFYAPNITPYGVGKWTDGELLRAITAGVDKDGKALFPVMASHRFGKMDREDVYSIIAYIRTLPSIEKDIAESEPDFPVNILINTMPVKAGFRKKPDESDAIRYGAYLVNATGCIDCHSKTDKGAIIPGTEFGGGMEFQQPGGIVRSPNITFDQETGLGLWTQEAFVARFRMHAQPGYKPAQLNKGDLNTPMPWSMYAGMKEKDLASIYTYLKSLKPIKNSVVHYEKR